MTQQIDPQRLVELRKRKNYSQANLAEKAVVTKQTVYRLENGRQKNLRKNTLLALCKALGVDEDVLSGRKPLPPLDAQPSSAVSAEEYQLNVRMDGAIRNAFTLTSLRYGISIPRMVELAPLLVGLVCEQSLKRRQEKLSELLTLFDHEDKLARNFPHLPGEIVALSFVGEEAIQGEQRSIKKRDVFGAKLALEHVDADYDEGADNPLVVYLREVAAGVPGVESVDRYDGRYGTEYRVCRDEALALAGGDVTLAEDILDGCVALHEMPRELFKKASAERVAWLRQKSEEARERADKFFAELGISAEDLGLGREGDGAVS